MEDLRKSIVQAVKGHEQWVSEHADYDEQGDPTDEEVSSFQYLNELTPQVTDDVMVRFCPENSRTCGDESDDNLLGYHTLQSGLSFLGVSANGDWECPVCFIIYHDGSELRGYVPDKGNPWDRNAMEAYREDDVRCQADAAEMLKEIEETIRPRPSKNSPSRGYSGGSELAKLFRQNAREMARAYPWKHEGKSPIHYCEKQIEEAIKAGHWKKADMLIQEELDDVNKIISMEKARRDALASLKRRAKDGY